MTHAPRSELPLALPRNEERPDAVLRPPPVRFSPRAWGERMTPRPRWFGGVPLWSVAVMAAVGCLTLAPLVSLVLVALGGSLAIWRSFAASVLPAALVDTGLLLGGVAIV